MIRDENDWLNCHIWHEVNGHLSLIRLMVECVVYGENDWLNRHMRHRAHSGAPLLGVNDENVIIAHLNELQLSSLMN